jgi:hypothetical protein
MNKKFSIIFVLFFSFIFLLQAHPSYAWLSGWQYRKPITINNTQNTNTLTDYQVAINLTYSSNMQPDFSDIRFTWYNSTDGSEIEIPYWIESKVNSAWAYVWVKVPYIPASSTATIYVYYGNTSTVSSASNPRQTMEFYEDWEPYNSLSEALADWIVMNNNCVNCWKFSTTAGRGGSKVVYQKSDNTGGWVTGSIFYKPKEFNPTSAFGLVAEFYHYWDVPESGNPTDQTGLRFVDEIRWDTWNSANKVGYNLNDEVAGNIPWASKNGVLSGVAVSIATQVGVWRKYKIIWNTSGVYGWYEGQYMGYLNNTFTPTIPLNLSLTGHFDYSYIVGYFWDDIKVYKISYPEPTYSIGAEEIQVTVTIEKPQATNYHDGTNFEFKFKATSPQNTTFILKAWLNGVLKYDNSTYQNDTWVVYYENLSLGNYNFTVQASAGLTVAQSVLFSIVNDPPQIIAYSTNIPEQWDDRETIFVVWSDDRSSKFSIWMDLYVDGERINTVCFNPYYQNYSNFTCTITFPKPATYIIEYWANDDDPEQSKTTAVNSTSFVVRDYQIVQIIFNSIAYETSDQNYSIVFKVNLNFVRDINSNLIWNNTDKGIQDWKSTNSTHLINTKQITVPLIQQNNTQISFYFLNNVSYKNSNSTLINSSSNNQNVIFAYWIDSIASDKVNYSEFDDATINLSVKDVVGSASFSANFIMIFNSSYNETKSTSNYTQSGSTKTFQGIFNLLEAFNPNETRNVSALLSVSFGSNFRLMQSPAITLNVYQTILTNCSYLSSTTTLLWIIKDEETGQDLSFTLFNQTQLIIDVSPLNQKITRTYYFNKINQVCIYPSWATYLARISGMASRSNYAVTTHYPYQLTYLNNQTKTLTLYMLPSSLAVPVTFTLPEQDYIIAVERNYEGFVYLRSDKADFNKKAVIYLRPYDILYRITVYTYDYKLCFPSAEFKVATNTYEIPSCTVGVQINITPIYERNLQVDCKVAGETNESLSVECDYYAKDNIDHDVTFTVYKHVKPFGKIVYYNQSQKAVSGSFQVTLQKGFVYEAVFVAHSIFEMFKQIFDLSTLIFISEIFFIVLLIYGILAVVGYFNPFLGFLSMIAVSFILSVLGLMNLLNSVVAGLGILFVFAIIFTREWK